MLEVEEQKVEEDFCLWLGYDGEDTVQVVWIFVRETWRLNSAVGGSEVSGTVLGTCSGRKKNTVLTTQLHPDSLTCCGNSMIFDGLCIHFWTFSVAQELCELPARMESVIFKAFCGWRNKVCALTGVDSMCLNPSDSSGNITHMPLLIPLPITPKTCLGRRSHPKSLKARAVMCQTNPCCVPHAQVVALGGHTEPAWASVTCWETWVPHPKAQMEELPSRERTALGGDKRRAMGTRSLEKALPGGWSPATSLPLAGTSMPQFPLEKIRKCKYLDSKRTQRGWGVPMSLLSAGSLGNPREARGQPALP